MADNLGNGEFWLPSEFLTDDDILMDKENFNKNEPNTAIRSHYCFPTEFPYDSSSFDSSSVLSSPVESVFGSIETESDGEDLLTGLTRHLARSTLVETQHIRSSPPKTEKTWVLSSSPQSTLLAAGNWSGRSPVSSNGSPNGPSQLSSPTATPVGPNNDAWDLIYAAAGQVARLKMNGEGPPKSRGLIDPHRRFSSVHQLLPVKKPNSEFYSSQCPSSNNFSHASQFQYVRENQVLNQQCSSIWGKAAKEGLFYQQNQFQFGANHPNMSQRGKLGGCDCESNKKFGPPLGLSQSSWPSLQFQQNHHHHQNQTQTQTGSGMRAVFLGGSNVKKECAGTGVFLPRRYGNPSDSRKKSVCSTALLPARVVQALNKNFEDMAHAHPQSPLQWPSHTRL